jgi:hypothetical protein
MWMTGGPGWSACSCSRAHGTGHCSGSRFSGQRGFR